MEIFIPKFQIKDIGSIQQLSEIYDWGIQDLKIPDVWLETKGENTRVMIIDSGMSNHPDIGDNELTRLAKSFNKETVIDKNGHGCIVSGIVGAKLNSTGIVGVAPECKLIPVKVLNKQGRTDDKILKKALEYAIKVKPDVINMSLGSWEAQKDLEPLYKKLIYELNIPIVCAAGNEGKRGVMYPAKYPYTISVGSYKKDRTLSEFSAYSELGHVDFVAPGDEILSTYLNKQYAVMSGTSMAAPFVSGILALIISKYKKNNESYTSEQLRTLLATVAIDVGKVGKDEKFGHGIIDVASALRQIEGLGITSSRPDWKEELKEKIKNKK